MRLPCVELCAFLLVLVSAEDNSSSSMEGLGLDFCLNEGQLYGKERITSDWGSNRCDSEEPRILGPNLCAHLTQLQHFTVQKFQGKLHISVADLKVVPSDCFPESTYRLFS